MARMESELNGPADLPASNAALCQADRRRAGGRGGQRCPVCGNAGWLDHAGGDECTHCRLIVGRDADLRRVAVEIERRLAAGLVDFERDPASDWMLDPAGLRNVAWRFGFTVEPIAGQDGFPAGDRPARAIARPARRRRHAITLGIMTHEADFDATTALLRAVGRHFAAIVLVIDGANVLAGSIISEMPDARIAFHPLDGDFAAQRNRIQDMAGSGWVLQLDTDERPDALLLDSLGWLVAAADRDGLRSLGLARRNIVDGAPSALFPDIQYRLNQASVRFAGTVHERPVTKFEATSLALSGALEHRLDRARVRARTRIYEAMSVGAGRPEDEDLLLKPFDPIAVR